MASEYELDGWLIGRQQPLFAADMADHAMELDNHVAGRRFLVIGGAGTVGQVVVKDLLGRSPAALHVVDIDENGLVELVRDIRSSRETGSTDLRFFCVDACDPEFRALTGTEPGFDHVLYFAALKHVRSEKDPYTLMRMIRVNILGILGALESTRHEDMRGFFSVSTDKASNPVNAMGATKRAMEKYLLLRSGATPLTRVRLANVGFSSGSLPAGFRARIAKRQPLAVPIDVRRYFITPGEAGQICMLACLLGRDGDIFYPRREAGMTPWSFVDLARRYLDSLGYRPAVCNSEEEARCSVDACAARREWPCWFTATDTSGEKIEEEFVAGDACIDCERFKAVGVIKTETDPPRDRRTALARELERMLATIRRLEARGSWTRLELLEALRHAVPEFQHHETGRTLDAKM